MKVNKSETFINWYNNEFLCSRDPLSPILCSENRAAIIKFNRIGEVAKILIENPNKDIQEIREEIAMRFMISMRISLDYVHLAELVLKKYNK